MHGGSPFKNAQEEDQRFEKHRSFNPYMTLCITLDAAAKSEKAKAPVSPPAPAIKSDRLLVLVTQLDISYFAKY